MEATVEKILVNFMEKQEECNANLYNSIAELKTINAVQTEKIDKILEQTTKTNGRVTDLEAYRQMIINEYAQMMRDLKEERKDRRWNIRRVFWDIVRIAIVGLASATVALIGFSEIATKIFK